MNAEPLSSQPLAGFEEQGIAILSTEELEALTVGKTLTIRNLVKDQDASLHYWANGTHTISLVHTM